MTFIISKDKTEAVNLDFVSHIYYTATAVGTYTLAVDTEQGSIDLGEYTNRGEAEAMLRKVVESQDMINV